MAIADELPVKLRDKLADALSDCECVSMRADRKRVIEGLPSEVSKKILEADDTATGVRNIVTTCSRFPGVIYLLLDVIKRLEGNTFAYQKFSIVFAEVEVRFQSPDCEGALAELKAILNSFDLPGEVVAKLYAVCARGISQGAAQSPTELYPAFLELARRSPLKGFILLQWVLRRPDIGIVPQAQRLREWIEQYAPQFDIENTLLIRSCDEIDSETQSHVYVVVKILENQLLDDMFYVEAWSWRTGEGFCRLEIKSRLTVEDHHKFPDIETLLQAAICEVEEKFSTAGFVIEIITERKVFSKDISSWKVYVGEAKSDLLIHHPVVLRWKNRHERPGRHLRWQKKWAALRRLSTEAGLHDLKWLHCETACPPDEILNGWADEQNGICLALGYKPSEKSDDEDLLEAALNVGTPVVFWLQRTRDGETISKELFEDLLNQAKLIDLPAHVWKLRKKAYQDPDHPARRLMLLFDDADRVLPRAIGVQR